MNSRLDEMQAAILRVKLPHLDSDNSRRRALAFEYSNALDDCALTLPHINDASTAVWHQYVVRTTARDDLKNYLRERGIGTLIHYPVPVHQQPAYAHFSQDADLTYTESAAREVLSLPLYPELGIEDANFVAQQIIEWTQQNV
jgi:dTDP-4-amino-4,6-dideoxygalactose transaminase